VNDFEWEKLPEIRRFVGVHALACVEDTLKRELQPTKILHSVAETGVKPAN
jgi:hypothetical protein